MSSSSSIIGSAELGSSFVVSKLSNITQSLGRFLVPSLALAATALFTHAMAFQQKPPSPQPSLVSSRSSMSLGSTGSSSHHKRFDVPPTAKQVHLIVLVHGWLGSPAEMSSIQQALQDEIDDKSSSGQDDETKPKIRNRVIPDDTCVLVHSAECNAGRTHDGVTAGGLRVADEVNQLVQEILGMDEDDDGEVTNDVEISLSFIGNSLGGLYSRSAVASIQWDLPNGKRLIPNCFCTTCTPHLGKRGLTYIPLPRFAETGIGYALQPTGQDLFGINKVMEDLATQAKYVNPLKAFAKRIAYANAFGTDLQVPTSTAAFLADTESPHETQKSNPPFLLKVTTPRDDKVLESIVEATSSTGEGNGPHIPATTLSRALDAMGWTKVFCDVRDKLVSVPIPFKGEERSSEFTEQEKWTSHELKAVMASRNVHDKKWPIPIGHTMLIANAKSEFYAKLNKGGLPFVQQLASDFLDDVLAVQK